MKMEGPKSHEDKGRAEIRNKEEVERKKEHHERSKKKGEGRKRNEEMQKREKLINECAQIHIYPKKRPQTTFLPPKNIAQL
jgi:hypothetical protein